MPIVLITAWLGIAGVGGPTFGKLSEVISTDQASFLPADAASTKVREAQLRFEDSQYIPAIIVVESEKQIDRQAFADYAGIAATIGGIEGVAKENGKPLVIGPIPAKDQLAVQYVVPVVPSEELDVTIAEIRAAATDGAPDDAKVFVTGPAGLSADLSAAFGGIDGILLGVALAAVFIILLVVYRSILLPVLVLINSVFALCAAILVVFYMAKNGVIELNGQSQGILFILVIGAATDYSLLLVARYKEALTSAVSKWDAMKTGIKTSFEPILASAATVILALLCLLLSDLNSNRSLGPIAATGIAFSFLATITFLPALLVVFGKFAFWPSKITEAATKKPRIKTGMEDISGIWLRVGRLVQDRPRQVWIATLAVLLLFAMGLTGLRASGVSQTDLLLTQSNARDGLEALGRHFDAGAGAPVLVQVPESRRDAAAEALSDTSVLSDVQVYVDEEVSPSKRSADVAKARVIDGVVLFSATLTSDPYGTEAQKIITELRKDLAAIDTSILVGGTSALALDTVSTAERDLAVIIPVVLVVITVVLALLLRSLIAPLVLIGTVVVSFAATLGLSALVFNYIFGFPGADPSVPLFGFVFLVALGVDYNIFLVSRTREEALKMGTKAAIVHSLGKTGGVITSAGIVLAATFAALGIIPILFLAQLAFIVAVGVLIDTIIVRSLLVPALFDDIGKRVWWPSKHID